MIIFYLFPTFYFVCAFLRQSYYQKKKVYLHFSDLIDAQVQFKQLVNVIDGIHSESWKKHSSFKLGPINVQILQISEQTRKNNKILL